MGTRSRATGRRPRRLVALVAMALCAVSAAPGLAAASAGSPTVSTLNGGAGAPVVSTTGFDLGRVGYQASEFVLSGTASAYTPTTPLSPDGRWSLAPSSTAPFTTRAVVYRPTDPAKFNGRVLVEWLNVSGGLDAGPDWVLTHNHLVREGFAWVGVSAQAVGVNASKSADPARYAALSHPGDSYSYDIFSQVGQAIRDNGPALLGGATATHLLAAGESQSAGRMVTYINGVHPLVDVYDGFLVHSRSSGGGAALSQAPLPAVAVPNPTLIRDDQDEPVLVFQAETDVFNSNLAARQPDSDRFRLWEVAGTAHFDAYGLTIGMQDVGDGQGAVEALQSMQHPTNEPLGGVTCALAINTGPMHWVLDAAVHWLDRWVREGTPPPSAARLETTATSPVVFAVDEHDNVRGGVRTPHVDAPIATIGGAGNSGAGAIGQFCRLFGKTVPLDERQLAALYGSRGQFVEKWTQATDAAASAGFLVPADAEELRQAAHDTVLLQRGEWLWKVAREVLTARGAPTSGPHVAAFVRELYAANRDVIGGDPHRLRVGTVLQLPRG